MPLERAGNRLTCPSCRSCLVPMADLEAAMRAMWRSDQAPPRTILTPLVDGFARSRPCPACSAAMAPCMLLSISVDRCHAHGVWFDHDELERVLHASAPRSSKDDDDGPLETTGGIIDGLGDLLDLLGIFLPD
jgi:hypothetical protein